MLKYGFCKKSLRKNANKYELTFKCCCNEPKKCVGSVVCTQLFAGSLASSDRGLTSLILQTKTSRNMKKNPRFRYPDFFQEICRYSHTKLINEITLHNSMIGRIKVNFESINVKNIARNFSSEIWNPVSENWFVYIQNLFSWDLNIPALSILYRIHIDVYSSPAKVGGRESRNLWIIAVCWDWPKSFYCASKENNEVKC